MGIQYKRSHACRAYYGTTGRFNTNKLTSSVQPLPYINTIKSSLVKKLKTNNWREDEYPMSLSRRIVLSNHEAVSSRHPPMGIFGFYSLVIWCWDGWSPFTAYRYLHIVSTMVFCALGTASSKCNWEYCNQTVSDQSQVNWMRHSYF